MIGMIWAENIPCLSRKQLSGRAKTNACQAPQAAGTTFQWLLTNMSARRHGRKWSAAVTHESNALDLEKGVFKSDNPHRIARSLKDSAERSHRRKGTPFQSAMSMLNFYINRAGVGLSSHQRNILTRARNELRLVFHKPPHEKSVIK
jgi:hypothetical protein